MAPYANAHRAQKPFVAGSPVNFELPLESGMLTAYVDFHVSGDVVVSAGSTTGTIINELPYALIDRIECDTKAKTGYKPTYKGGKLVSLRARSIKRWEIIDAGRVLPDIGTAAIDGTAKTANVSFTLRVYFALPRALRPYDTCLKHDAYEYVTFKVSCGKRDTLFSGNDRTWDTSGLKIDMYDAREYNPGFATVELFQFDTFIPVTQVAPRFDIDSKLPKNELMIEMLFVSETGGTGTLADTIINKVQLFNGTESVYERFKDAIKTETARKIPDAATSQTGVLYVPVATGGRLSTAQIISKAQLDVAAPSGGTDMLTLATRTYVPPVA